MPGLSGGAVLLSPAFSAKNLRYRFEGCAEYIIDGMNFDIEPGAFVSIVGPNGAGKSTLLNIMLGYSGGYEGTLDFFGNPLNTLSPQTLALRRAYIPQQSEDSLKLSAYEYLKLSRINPRETEDRHIDEILEKFDISYLKHRSIALMSGGEARLTQLAFALLRKPEALLLDEPVSYLDYKNQQIFFELLKKEHKTNGLTIISILHDLDLAAYYSDKIILINEGRLLKYAAPADVLNYKTLGSIFFESKTRGFNKADRGKSGGSPRAKIHVICGGGSGEQIISKLLDLNFEVSCGVLNAGDSDWRFCRASGVSIVEEEPYRPISNDNYSENLKLIKNSRAVVICKFHTGNGNIANLEFIDEFDRAAKNGGDEGKLPELICAGGGLDELDFTGGRASNYLERIKKNARIFNSIEEFEKIILTLT